MPSTRTINSRIRSQRLSEARKIDSHTKQQWIDMKLFFENTCAKCFGASGLIHVEKDHIIPIYMGGSDGIDNLQPLCARCNAGKGCNSDDLRPNLANKLNKQLPDIYKLKLRH